MIATMTATELQSEPATQLGRAYVDYHDGGYWVAGTRISLDSLVYCWRNGDSPETIQRECFPVLTLAEVFGALAFYSDNRAKLDQYLLEGEKQQDVIAQKLRAQYPDIHRRVDEILQTAKTK